MHPALPASPLAALQQARIRARMTEQLMQSPPDLRAPWPRRRLLWLAAAALAATSFTLLLPQLRPWLAAITLPAAGERRPEGGTQLVSVRLAITPPAYTQLPLRRVDTADASVPADSTVAWQLALDRAAEAVTLSFHDGSRLDLRRAGDVWQGSRTIDAASVYRIELRGAAALADDRGYRLDVVADQPPEIVIRAPEQTLTVITAAQAEWPLLFEAKDDYGLGAAELTISHAQGAGDQVKVREQRLPLTGDGDARSRRYRHRLDLKALGYGQGDDLIVRLTVADQRAPTPQSSSSPSLILRWPADSSAVGEGLEGGLQKVAPAYFRSQRQIIIDTEALQAARPTISANQLQEQADTLGVDQKILRLRYGEFLGEEFENGGPHDGEPASEAPTPFGEAGDLLHEYGHAHNESEAATLMDPATKVLLRSALNEMWQAELRLRQAQPDAALPFEYKALALIKQVQQAERIYRARTGLDLPPFDATRRLSGEREGLGDRSRALDPRVDDDTPFPALLQQLDGDGRGPVALAPLLTWVRVLITALGSPETMPAKMIRDTPLPMPRSVICSPSHIRKMVPVVSATTAVSTKPMPWS